MRSSSILVYSNAVIILKIIIVWDLFNDHEACDEFLSLPDNSRTAWSLVAMESAFCLFSFSKSSEIVFIYPAMLCNSLRIILDTTDILQAHIHSVQEL